MPSQPRMLDQLRIASPCLAAWEDMHGDDRVRFCDQCQLEVYNLSAMTEQEGTELVQSRSGGRLCAAMFRRADGTVLTRDCPVGLARVRKQVARAWAAALTVGAFFVANIGGSVGAYWLLAKVPGGKSLMRDPLNEPSPASRVAEKLAGEEPRVPSCTVSLGWVIMPSAPPLAVSPETDLEVDLGPSAGQ